MIDSSARRQDNDTVRSLMAAGSRMEVATQEDTCQIVLLCYRLPMGSTTWLQMYSYARQALYHRIWLRRPACLTGSRRRRGLRYARHGLPRATHSGGVFAHQPGAATFSESTGQPGQSKLHKVVPAGLRPPNRTTRTYVGPADIVRYSWAREQHDRDQWQTWAGDGRQARAHRRSGRRRQSLDSDD